MNLKDLAETSWTWLNEVAISPLAQFYRGLGEDERIVLYILLATAAALGFLAGRRRARHLRLRFQTRGEVSVANHLRRHFRSPDYHLIDVPPSVVPHPMLDLEPTAGQEAGAF